MVEKKGFKWVNERPDAKSENDEKWGWIGEKPGAHVLLALAMLFGYLHLQCFSAGGNAAAGRLLFWMKCCALCHNSLRDLRVQGLQPGCVIASYVLVLPCTLPCRRLCGAGHGLAQQRRRLGLGPRNRWAYGQRDRAAASRKTQKAAGSVLPTRERCGWHHGL